MELAVDWRGPAYHMDSLKGCWNKSVNQSPSYIAHQTQAKTQLDFPMNVGFRSFGQLFHYKILHPDEKTFLDAPVPMEHFNGSKSKFSDLEAVNLGLYYLN